jgi:hypothetical protein
MRSRVLLEPLEDRILLSFLPPVNYGVGTSPEAVAIGDFNHDGVLDLATANFGSNDVSVLLGKGDGTFASAVNYNAGSAPDSVIAGDFRHDGILDLAEANAYSDNVSVLLGNGDGTFKAPVSYPAGGRSVYVAAGDFDGDGILDLVVVNNSTNNVSVLLGNGNGTFERGHTYAVGESPVAPVIGDFNRDGKLDLAVVNAGSNSLSILLGKGDGTFENAVPYAVGSVPNSVVAGDFTGNGVLDLAVANEGSNDVSVLLGNGDGTFRPKVDYPAGMRPVSVVAADFNHRGTLDLAVSNADDNSLSVLAGDGDGTFQSKVDYALGFSPGFLAVAELDQNGYPDLVVPCPNGNGVYILLNQPVATHFLVTAPASLTAGSPFSFTVTALGPANTITTGFSGTIALSSSDGLDLLPSAYTFTTADQGVHTFSGVTLFSDGVRSITASDNGITGTAVIVVNPAAAGALYVNAPDTVMAGTPLDLTVYAYDAFGNFARGYTGVVSFSSSDSSAILPSNYHFTPADAGIASLPGATLFTQGVQYITVQDNLGLSDTISVNVTLPPSGGASAGWLFIWSVEKSRSLRLEAGSAASPSHGSP